MSGSERSEALSAMQVNDYVAAHLAPLHCPCCLTTFDLVMRLVVHLECAHNFKVTIEAKEPTK